MSIKLKAIVNKALKRYPSTYYLMQGSYVIYSNILTFEHFTLK